MGEKILVTGGGGYKGVKIVEAALKKGASVTALDTFPAGIGQLLHLASNRNLNIVFKDVRDDLSRELAGHDIVVHLAGISGFPACNAQPAVAKAVNVDATASLARALSRDQLLIFASTTAMYEVAPSGTVDENTPVDPVGSYTSQKKLGEVACFDAHEKTVAFRVATVMGLGPALRTNLLVNDFARKAVADRCLVLFNADAKRTFIHIDDATRGYMLALDSPDRLAGGIFNLGDESLNFSKRTIAETIQTYTECELVDSSLPDRDSRDFYVSFDKIRQLGFRATRTLDQTVEELVRFYRVLPPGRDITGYGVA